MSSHDDRVDLSGLFLGELTNAQVGEVASHLDRCEECRAEVAELAVGHALLSSAARTLGGAALVPNPTESLPPGASPAHRARRVRRGVTLGLAAAVVIGAGVAGAGQFFSKAPVPAAGGEPFASADLEPVSGTGNGKVMMAHDAAATTRMTIETHDLPTPRAGRFYYAWLLNPKTNKMLPLGQVGPGGGATFTLDDDLLDRYTAVDVSLEADDGDPQHSVTSVLRASYDGRDGQTIPS
jgi:hypothetical protein